VASFVRAEPLRFYHPISFLLEPLFTLRDEFYTIFFNLSAPEATRHAAQGGCSHFIKKRWIQPFTEKILGLDMADRVGQAPGL
jgi:hypothetical protein